jgi:hypothetical protein
MAFRLMIFISGVLLAAPKIKPCNELKIDRCKERPDCIWVDTKKRKDGEKIKEHYRYNYKCI